MLSGFRKYFFSGLLVLGPLFITLIVILYLVRLADNFVVNPLFWIIPIELDARSKVWLAKALIAVCVVFFVTLIGFATQKFLFKNIFSNWEGVLNSIPLFNKIYFPIKDIAQALFGDKTGIFKRAVYVEYPRKDVYTLGFVTQEEKIWDIHEKTGKNLISVFVPSPPNPATGNYIFIPKEDAIDSDLSIEEAIKLVISGGAAVPPIKKK